MSFHPCDIRNSFQHKGSQQQGYQHVILQYCGVSVSEVEHEGGTIQRLFRPESQWLSFPSPSVDVTQVQSHCWTYLLNDGMEWGRTIGVCGGSNGT